MLFRSVSAVFTVTWRLETPDHLWQRQHVQLRLLLQSAPMTTTCESISISVHDWCMYEQAGYSVYRKKFTFVHCWCQWRNRYWSWTFSASLQERESCCKEESATGKKGKKNPLILSPSILTFHKFLQLPDHDHLIIDLQHNVFGFILFSTGCWKYCRRKR